jgi:3-oxoacid CoA-transferase subunit B
VVALMEHANKEGKPKILRRCTLPLTGGHCVDMVITDLCVFEIDGGKGEMRLIECAPGVTPDEVKAKTEARFSA